jgi:ParB family chromosome partitioning protein
MANNRGLGKGINAFFTTPEIGSEEVVQQLSLLEIRPNPYQPRKTFDADAIEELKQSILEHGVIQPIIVRKSIRGYEIVAGERRFRASKEAQLERIPAVVREFTEQQMMEIAIIENLQRENLNPIEEGLAYQTLLDKLNITQEELAIRLSKSRPYIANLVRLLGLPDQIKEFITSGAISGGHGRALLALKDKKEMVKIAEKVIAEGLNVRELEALIQDKGKNVSRETKKEVPKKDIFIREQETSLRDYFGTTVQIKGNKDKGKIEIEFFSKDDLNRILDLIALDPEKN